MRQIWKFPIETVGSQVIIMPRLAEILCVQLQNGEPHIWANVKPDADKTQRTLHVYGTGHTIRDTNSRYIGTYQYESFVWHVYELL